MNLRTTHKESEAGIALIIALITVLVLSVLAVAIMTTSQAQTWTAFNYRLTSQARYSAEAGVQQTMNWLSSSNYTAPTTFTSYTMTTNPVTYGGKPVVLSAVSGVSSNYPDSTVVSKFSSAAAGTVPNISSATYATYATLLRMTPSSGVPWLPGVGTGVMQTWQITSVGNIGGLRSSTVQLVETFERAGEPVFQYGLEALGTGCGAITLAGGDYTDSYNSSLGTYASQVVGGTGYAGNQGSIATNGNVSLGTTGGTAMVHGNIGVQTATVGACPAHGVTDAGSSNYGGITSISKMTAPLPWGCTTTPCYPPATPALITTAQNISTQCSSGGISGCTKGTPTCSTGSCTTITISPYGESSVSAHVYSLAPNMSYGNLEIDNSDVVHVTAGTYNVNSLNFGTIAQNYNGQIVVDSGPVIFNIVGNCASGCPTYTEPSSYNEPASFPKTSVISGAGFAGFNVCALGVVALKPGDATHTYCGTSTTPGVTATPSNFQIVYGGSNLIRVGGMPNAAVTYAPQASYFSPGGAVGYYGSIVTGQFADTSASPFHYDIAEQNNVMQVGQFRPVGGFSWSKF